MTDLKKGARLTLRVDRLSLGGDALGRAGDAVVFVPYGSPGDALEVELTETRKNFARGRLIRVLEPSPVRIDPPCPYHFQAPPSHPPPHGGRTEVGGVGQSAPTPHPHLPRQGGKEYEGSLYCGGCSWQHMNYEFQLDAKRQLVQETLERLGGVRDVTVKPTLGMKDPWRYRNKVQQPVGWDACLPARQGRRIISGFYAPFSHDIVPIEDCRVQSELSVRIVNRVRALLEQFQLLAYDEEKHTGWIRHLWVRTAQNKALLVFVTRTDDFPHQNEVLEALAQDIPELVGVHQNINPGKTNVILGRHWRKCGGADYLEERLGALRFHLSPGSFFQVNARQTEVLYEQVKALAGKGGTLIDLYCGVGGIALWLAPQFRGVTGVDEVKSAVADAQNNAKLNGITNTRFVADSAERFLSKYHGNAGFQGDLTVVLDPPRAGCDPRVLHALSRLRPSNLIYVSCDPGTLARDLGILGKAGFRPRDVQPVDLFPHTPHIETVVRLVPLAPRRAH